LYCEIGHWEWISSEVVEWEGARTENESIREELEILSSLASKTIKVEETTVLRSRHFEKWNIKGMDALHLACAESGKVDVFLSTDDHLLKHAKGHQKELGFKVVNPLEWIQSMEIL
jgi:predicted nucleic acid-binding protein